MKRFLSVLLILGLLMSIFAVGASAAAPDWLDNDEITTLQWFQKGWHRFVVHFLFGWLWMPWFDMLWYGGMDYMAF